MKDPMPMKILPWTAALFFTGCLFQSDQANRGSVVDNELRVGMIYLADGKPAANARVQVFPVGHVPEAAGVPKTSASAALVFSTFTDKDGRYSLDSLPKGQYNILGNLQSEYSYLDSVFISDSTRSLASDTLKEPGSVTGVVTLEPNHDRRTVFVQVLGTNIFVNADADGRFTLKNMSRGEYSLRVVTTLPDYTPYFGGLRIHSGRSDTLADTLRLTYTGIPVVRNLQGTVDTVQSTVRLAWKPVDYGFLKEYLVYRTAASSVSPSLLPIARTRDTAFVDTLTDTDLVPWTSSGPAQKFDYQVRVRNLSDGIGLPFGSLSMGVAPVTAVRTFMSVAQAGSSVLRASVGDTVKLILSYSNPTRRNDSLLWSEAEGGKILRRLALSGREGLDTLRLPLPASAGSYPIMVRIVDHSGSVWSTLATMAVEADVPLVSAGPDTSVSILDPIRLHGRATQEFGNISKYEWDIGNRGEFVKTATGDTVVVAPTVPGKFICVFRVTDDDGNVSVDTLAATVVLDPPVALAGKDTSVTISDTIPLHGRGSDAFGRIVKWEWNIGPGRQFISAPDGEARFLTRSTPGYDTLILRVTDDDGNTSLDTIRVAAYDDIPNVKISASDRLFSEGSGYNLKVAVEDKGKIVKWEWSTDTSGIFVTRSRGDTSFAPKDPVGGYLHCKLRATDDDGHVVIATVDLFVTRWSVVAATNAASPMAAVGGKLFTSKKDVPTGRFIYDPSSGKINESSSSQGHGAKQLGLGRKIYDFGGGGLFEYDTDFDSWIKRSETQGRDFNYPAATILGDEIYYTDLYVPSGTLTHKFSVFNTTDNSWTEKPDLLGLFVWELAGLNGIVYSFSGTDYSSSLGTNVLAFDTTRDIWEPKSSLPDSIWKAIPESERRYGSNHSWSAAVNGKIYIGSGTVVLEYNPALDSWKRKSSLLHPNNGQEAAVIEGKIYVLDTEGYLQIYDPSEEP